MSHAGKRFPRIYHSKGASEYRYVAAQEEEPIKVEDEVQTLISAIEIEDGREAGELTQLKVELKVELKMMDGGEAGERTQLKVEDDVVQKGEAGEQTQLDVEVDVVEKGEAGERTQLVDGMKVVNRGEAGELTQLKVVEKGEADERTQDEEVRVGENKRVDVEVEAAGGHSCSGSVVDAVEGFVDEDWLQDSVVIDIGGWSDELDADAIAQSIAVELDAAGLGSLVFEKDSLGSELKVLLSCVDVMLPTREAGELTQVVGVFENGSDGGVEESAVWIGSLIGAGSGAADDSVLQFSSLVSCDEDVDAATAADSAQIEGVTLADLIGRSLVRVAGSDLEDIRGSGRFVYEVDGVGKEKLIEFEDAADARDGNGHNEKISGIGCNSVVRVIGSGISDGFGRSFLYDPGGSFHGVDFVVSQAEGLLVSSVFSLRILGCPLLLLS